MILVDDCTIVPRAQHCLMSCTEAISKSYKLRRLGATLGSAQPGQLQNSHRYCCVLKNMFPGANGGPNVTGDGPGFVVHGPRIFVACSSIVSVESQFTCQV